MEDNIIYSRPLSYVTEEEKGKKQELYVYTLHCCVSFIRIHSRGDTEMSYKVHSLVPV